MTALSERPLDQSPAGPAFEVWRQTLLESLSGINVPDPDWIKKFHDGTVDMPLVSWEEYDWPNTFGCAIFPTAVESETPNIGTSDLPFAILTALYFKESAKLRDLGEADIQDAMWYLTAAALSQDKLTWKTDWAPSVPDPVNQPLIIVGVPFAVKRLVIGPVSFEDFEVDGGCARVVFREAVWELKISRKAG